MQVISATQLALRLILGSPAGAGALPHLGAATRELIGTFSNPDSEVCPPTAGLRLQQRRSAHEAHAVPGIERSASKRALSACQSLLQP